MQLQQLALLTKIELRDYQSQCVAAIKSSSGNVNLVVLPTGAGKSIIFAALSTHYPSALVIVPKVSLALQIEKTLHQFHQRETVGVVCGSLGRREIDRAIVITTMQSSKHVLESKRIFDIAICDECHRIDFEQDDSLYYKVFTSQPRVVGFTATPFRSGIYIYGDGKPFPQPIYSQSLNFTTAHGYTVRAITIEPIDHKKRIDLTDIKTKAGDWDLSQLSERIEADEEKLKDQVLDALTKSAARKQILWACVSTKHADMVAELLSQSEEPYVTIHSNSDEEIDDITTDTRHIVSVMMFSEGVDIPRIDCVVLLRPTKSPTLMVQIVGRALRPYPNKLNALVLDYGQVFRNCGPLDQPMVTEEKTRKKQTVGEFLETRGYRSWQCMGCGALSTVRSEEPRICTHCGKEELDKIKDEQLMHSSDIDASMYKDKPRWFPVIHIKIRPYWKFPRERKELFIYVDRTKALFFTVWNPRMLPKDNMKRVYAARSFEDKIEKFLRDVTGDKLFDIAHPQEREWNISPGIEVKATTAYDPNPPELTHELFSGAKVTHTHQYDKLYDWRRVVNVAVPVEDQLGLL